MAQKTSRSKGAKTKSGRGSGERYQKAVEGLERAVKALYRGDADKAKDQLERLAETYSEETELMDRVRTYLLMCDKQLSPQRRPKTAEEWVNAGVIALNQGDPSQAVKHLTKALDLEPKNAHILYCLAAAHAISGDASSTAKLLKQAISEDPAVRVQVKNDTDFARVRESSEVAPLLAEA